MCNKTYVDSVGGSSILSTNNTWTGTNNFNTNLPTSTDNNPTLSTQLCNKSYVDFRDIQTIGAIRSADNVFTGINTFNTNLPTSTISATTANQLTNKTYVDTGDANTTTNIMF